MKTTTSKTATPKIRVSDDVAAGAFSGIVARLLTSPFDLIKIRFQLQTGETAKYTSVFQAMTTLVREEGFFALWKGNLSATLLWVSYAMVQFSVYGLLKQLGESFIEAMQTSSEIPGEDHSAKPSSKLLRALILFLAGAAAGIVSTAATYPFDIMRTQFALQGQTTIFPTMQSFVMHTLNTKGVSGFYGGLTPAIIGIAPYMGLNFALYESFKRVSESIQFTPKPAHLLSSNASDRTSSNGPTASRKLLSNSLCGGLAGGVSKFIVYPLDTIKKRLQSQHLQNTFITTSDASKIPQYTGIVSCAKAIYHAEGLIGFYKGLTPTILKAVTATAITFAAYEFGKDMIAKIRSRNEETETMKNKTL